MTKAANCFQSIALIGNHQDARVRESIGVLAMHLVSRHCQVLIGHNMELSVAADCCRRMSDAELATAAQLLIAVGGDGTMLYAARIAVPSGIPLLGINRGRLGFLADIGPSEMLDRLDQVLAGDFDSEERRLLRAQLIASDGTEITCEALNDVVLQRWKSGRMLDFETRIDGRYVNSHGGDGLIVSTATGSTAYALSCGGPILHPGLEALVILPVAPHALSDRPIVVRSSSVIEVRLLNRPDVKAQVICDGHSTGELIATDRLIITPATNKVRLIHPRGYDYFSILRQKLHWGRGPLHSDDDAD
jgi:NAD+ kinase